MEMREVLSREGRDAKNLLVYQFCDDTTSNSQSGGVLNGDAQQMFPNYRKPPVAPPRSPNSLNAPPHTPKKCRSPTNSARQMNSSNQCSGPRVRSASTGRDKKSELQARYWALLFGNLQRAVNEIYQTVECYENISSCQEAILVLENYVRDFKALSEWFKVSWDYESRPLQQRPQSLAWEVRKSNPVPRVRAKSLSSPTASGKSSPALFICNSGKTSPSDGQLSPKKMFRAYEQLPKGAMRVNVRELFAANKRPTQDPIDVQPTQRELSQTPMEEVKIEVTDHIIIEGMSHQYSQTDLEDDHLTLADLRKKLADLKEEQERIESQRLEEEQRAQRAEEERQEQLAEEERQKKLVEEIQLTNDIVQQKDIDKEIVQPEAERLQSDQLKVPAVEEKLPDVIPDTIVDCQRPEETNKITSQEEVVIELKPQTALELTVRQMDAMENALLTEQAKPTVLSTAPIKPAAEVLKKVPVPPGPVTNPVQNSPLKYSSVLNRPAAVRTTTQKATTLATTVGKTTKPVISNNNKPVTGPAPGTNGFRRTGTVPSVNNRTSTMRTTRNSVVSQPARPSSKTECHGPPNNVASRLSARSRTMIDMNGNNTSAKPLQRRLQPTNASASNPRLTKTSSSVNNSRKSSHEDIGSSSSTLKASNEQIGTSRTNCAKVDEESHTQSKQLSPDADDGWLTVKTRRRSSMHWSNRFHQPTGYASLPTLALLNEQQEQQREQENSANKKNEKAAKPIRLQKAPEKATKPVPVRPEIKNAKAKVNSLPVQRKNLTNNVKKPEKSTLVAKATIASRQSIIKRQKSDLTGLKMTSLHKEFMRSEKNALRKQQLINDKDNSNISSSAETVVEAPIANQTTDADSAGEHNKIDIKIQTNREFSKTIGELYESIARTNKGEKLTNGCAKSSIAMLSSCDETDENAFASGEDGEEERNERMLIEEQELLERQIRELESTEIDIDTEIDETDCEVVLEDHDDFTDQSIEDASAVVFVTMSDDENISLELRYQALLSEMTWNERVETLATLQAFVTRHPGRAQELHQKLSSPSRRRSLQETLKKYQAKHARAQEKREFQQKEKSVKIQQLLTRVEAVKTAKKQLIEDKRLKMEGRLQRAAENREQFLRQIVEKAHDEEKKLKEINFIKSIEAQNKRLDLLESSKETEGRLQDLEQERQKRMEEKAAKEAAVERRRQELEKERQRKLEKLNESRLEKEQRIGKMQEEKERQRQELAREKARDREERLLALQVQQQQTTEELQRKILQKQMESARRHEENIEHIRQRAVELTIPTRNVDEQRPDNEQTEAGDADTDTGTTPAHSEDCDHSSTISELGGREHSRSYKKKMKKLKQRMTQSAAEYFKEMEPLSAHIKRESQVPKLLHLITKGGGAQGLERDLGNLLRLLPKAQVCDFQTFLHMDGLGIIATNVILKGLDDSSEISRKSITLAVQLYRNACSLCPQIARHALLGNSITTLFDAIIKSMQLPEEKSPQQPVELSTELMLACTEALSSKYVKKSTHPKVPERLPDVINYAVITGLIEILSRRCMKIRESIENNQSVMLSLLTTLGFLSRFIDVCPVGPADSTRLLNAAKSTDLFGTVSMLYASVVPIGECIPKRTISLAASAFNLFVSLATLDINTFQDIVASETVSVKLFDVMTILMNYCGNKTAMVKNSETQTMMIDLIATISFFCVNRRKHQDLLTSEQCSIIIKCLAKLPEYYNPVVYPCLVTMTYKNQNARNVISQDFNLEFLDEYRKSDIAKKNHLIALIKDYV